MHATLLTDAVPLEQIRSQFPALQRTVAAGDGVAYFDGPGGTQVPRSVVDAMADYMYHHNANTHWEYPSSAETDAMLAAARDHAAAFVNGGADEIVFGANMTTLTFHLARALGRGWRDGDEVVVTELDHHANVAPWTALARERGIGIRTVRMDTDTGQLDMEDLQRQVTPRCRLLAVGAASNALGTMSDVRAAADIAHAVGALVFVDAVHYAPHVLPDVHALGCDALACSAYKFYGPHVGMLWLKRELLSELDPPKLLPAPDHGGERLETGTLNHEGIVGAAAAIEFLATLCGSTAGSLRDRLRSSYGALHTRGVRQVTQLWNGLRSLPGVRVYGPAPDQPRSPTVSFTVDNVPADEVARRLAVSGVFVSHGDFYAQTVVERLGLQPHGLVRAGCAAYTSDEEVERLVAGVAALVR